MNDPLGLIFFSILAVALIGAWIWAIANLITTPGLSSTQKVIGFLVLFLLQTFGLLLYLALSPGQKDRNKRQTITRV